MEEQKREVERDIVVLDEGIDVKDSMGPRSVCCRGAYFPVR